MSVETQARKAADVLGEEVVQGTISKLVQIERERCLRQIERLRQEIRVFENRFGKSSQQAWEAYQGGKLGDDADVMEWMMLIQNLHSLEAHLDLMAGIQGQ
jgi:hypothetical protein